MAALFQQVLSMSLAGSAVILVVLLARVLMIGAPKKWSYYLWSAAVFRLCCPLSFRSVFSVFSAVPQTARMFRPVSEIQTLSAFPDTLLSVPAIPSETITAEAMHSPDWGSMLAAVWIIGVVILLIWSVARDLRLRRRLLDAVILQPGVYESDRIASPFILGVFHPKIYLPIGVDGRCLRYVLEHERYHLRRRDPWIKLFAFCVLVLHWFNPLCWAAYLLMNRDMELSCDEHVLSAVGGAKDFSLSILSFAASGRFPVPGVIAFGESDVSRRVKAALRWRTPKPWVTIISLLLCVGVIAACAANPAGENGSGDPAPSELSAAEANESVSGAYDWSALGISVDYGESSLFTREDMDAALDAIMKRFAAFGDGFVMERIAYASDDVCNAETVEWMNQHQQVPGAGSFTECICFYSDYHTPPMDEMEQMAWNPDAEYSDWGWWLARADGGDWIVVDMGY